MIDSIENDEGKHGSLTYYALDAFNLPLTQRLEFNNQQCNFWDNLLCYQEQ